MARLDELRLKAANGTLPTAHIRKDMQKIMQTDAAVFRTSKTLVEGCEKIDTCFESLADVQVP